MAEIKNYRRIWLHMRVIYYPTKEERRRCGFKKTMSADVEEMYENNVFDLKVRCFKGQDFEVTRCEKRFSHLPETKQEGVWDFTMEYDVKQ